MTVKIYVINEGQKTQYFGLMEAKENRVLYGAPNNWKTKKGAEKWAIKHGLKIA